MRKKIVAGNWKMNKNLSEGEELVKEIISKSNELDLSDRLLLICIPPFIQLNKAKEQLASSKVKLGAQNVHHEASGAFTGDISANMLASVGAEYCLVGHSERRTYYKESEVDLSGKVKSLLSQGIQVIFCVGETLEEREGGREFEVVEGQLKPILDLNESEISKVILAYEPVWAIGTGKTASSDQAQGMHSFIRAKLQDNFNTTIAENTSILYGGSCKPDNAADLFSKKDVDGGLIGGASLDSESFIAIAKEL